MFTSALRPAEQYRQVDTVTAVSQADPHQLVLLLFDGAIAAVLNARHALTSGDVAAKGAGIGRAMRIIDEGLKASLQSGGDGALEANLRALYDHMVSRLLAANVRNDDGALGEVARLLGDLRAAWAEIAPAAHRRIAGGLHA